MGHEAVVTCLYISCSLQFLPQPHLKITQEYRKETEGESEEDGEHSLQIMYLIISGCRLVKGGPCSLQFSKEHYTSTRANAAELSWNELNMAVMGQVMALTLTP